MANRRLEQVKLASAMGPMSGYVQVFDCRAPNCGNVVEDPLWDRIADGGNPGCQGQVATHGRHLTGQGIR